MSLLIRKLTDDDLGRVGYLFQPKKSYDEIKWLYSSPENVNEYNAFIAVSDDKIVGVIGYSFSVFYINDKKYSAVIPMSWLVDPSYRGLAGVRLLLNVMKTADFGFAIEGSVMAKNIYSAAKLKLTTKANTYRKIIYPFTKITSFKDFTKIFTRLLVFIYCRTKSSSLNKNNDIILEEVSSIDSTIKPDIPKSFTNEVTTEYLNWLLKCPTVKKYLFHIFKKYKLIGFAVCFGKVVDYKLKRARIVHISYLGENILVWRNTVLKIEKFMYKRKYTSISVLAKSKIFVNTLSKLGYIKDKRPKEIFLPENDLFSNIYDFTNWHLTYAISDKGYRGV